MPLQRKSMSFSLPVPTIPIPEVEIDQPVKPVKQKKERIPDYIRDALKVIITSETQRYQKKNAPGIKALLQQLQEYFQLQL